MERVSGLRHNLNYNHYDRNNIHKIKDIIFLDVALEGHLRQLVERVLHHHMSFEDYMKEAAMILSNLCLSFQWSELRACKEDWDKLALPLSKNMNEENARKLKSVTDRLKTCLGEVQEVMMDIIQKKAELLGKNFKCADYSVDLFSEEMIRGTLFFTLSVIMKKIDPHVRQTCNLGNWHVISPGRTHGCRGFVKFEKNLVDVMHNTYD